MKNSRKTYGLLFVAILLVALSSSYQPFAPSTLASSIPSASRVGSVANTTARVNPVLNFTLVVPKNNMMRRKYGEMVVNGLDNLGINATLSVLPFGQFINRTVGANSSVLGKTYAQGGFDIACLGWVNPSWYADPNPYPYYDSNSITPNGLNYYLWSNSNSDYLCNRILHEMNQTKLLQLIQQEQELVYDEAPSVALYYPDYLVPIARNLSTTPIAASYDYSWPAVETWNYTSSPLNNVTLAQLDTNPEDFGGFVDLAFGAYVQPGQALASPIFGEGDGNGLLKRGAAGTLDVSPYMAYGNYTHSADYRNWTFWIRPDIKFQDGENLTAQDVVYTLRYMMTPDWTYSSSGVGFPIQSVLGSNASVYWAGEQGTPGASEPLNLYKLQFSLPDNYSFFLQEICTLPILPASVLVNSTQGIPDYSNWNPGYNLGNVVNFPNTAYNTGLGTCSYYAKNKSLVTCTGPFGAGPYKYAGYDSGTGILHLTKFSGYFNGTRLQAAGEYKIKDYYVKPILDADTAITELRDGSAQVLDSNYLFQVNRTQLNELAPSFCHLVAVPGLAAQEVGFNMQDPIFGTGLGTPVGMANASEAAAAAKDMRRGIEYLFLKDSILKNMTNGYAIYGVTTAVTPAMFGFDNNIALRNDTALNQRLLAISDFEAAGYHFYVDLTTHGTNATSPDWTLKQYGFSVAMSNANTTSVIYYTVAPPGATGAPQGAVPVVYLDVHGIKLQNSTQTILYVYYNRTRVQSLGVNESYLAIYVWNTTATPAQWSALTSTHLALNSTCGVVFAVAPHFSYFAVFGTTAPSGGGGKGGGTSLTYVLVACVAIIVVLVAIVVLRKKSSPSLAANKE